MSSIACSVGNSKSQTSFSAKAIALILCGVYNSHGRHVHSLVLLKARLQVQIADRFHNTTRHALIRVSFRGVTPSCDFLCMFRLDSQYTWPHLWILCMDAHMAWFYCNFVSSCPHTLAFCKHLRKPIRHLTMPLSVVPNNNDTLTQLWNWLLLRKSYQDGRVLVYNLYRNFFSKKNTWLGI